MDIMYGEEMYEETNRDFFMGQSDESKAEWLMKLLSSPKEIYRLGMEKPISVDIPNNEARKEWLSQRDDALTMIALKKNIFVDISSEPYDGVPLDFIAMQRAIFEATEQGIPINEHHDAMLLILKYYDDEGALFAISDKLKDSPKFIAEALSRLHIDSYGHGALDLTGVEDSTWSRVAKIIDDDKMKSRLLSMRLLGRENNGIFGNYTYDLVQYYEEHAKKYHLDDTLDYKGSLEPEDIPMPDCNDTMLLKYLLTLEDEQGNIAFSYDDLSNYFGSSVKENANFKMSALAISLAKRREKMQTLETESKTITESEALKGELEGKEGQDKGDE